MKKIIILLSILIIWIDCKGQTINYTYDNLGRLTQVAYPDSSIIRYSYDASGNRVTVKVKDLLYHTPQSLTFNALLPVVYGAADFDPGATSTNTTLPVTYTSGNTAVATVTAGNKVHITGAGTVTITAHQSGNNLYLAAVPVKQTLVVTRAPLVITAIDQTRIYKASDPKFTVSYQAFVNGDDVGKLSTQPMVTSTATLSSPVGVYILAVTGASSPNYNITYMPGKLLITPAPRLFVFNPLVAKIFTDPDFDPAATVDSGEPIIYSSSNPAVATIVNNKIHIIGAGTSVITATIAANANYKNAAPLSQTLTVDKAPQTIAFDPIPVQLRATGSLVLQVTASSGLPVNLTSSDPAVAIINGNTVQFQMLGSTIITAIQSGNNNFLAAIAVSQSLKIDNNDGSPVLVHRLLSPNGDGINDVLLIEGIKDYPDNNVLIVDRNGVKVFQASNYDNKSIVFDGHSNSTGVMVPQGTYFFRLIYRLNGQVLQKTDYFVVKL